MDRISQFLKENSTLIAVGAAAGVTLLGVGYYMSKRAGRTEGRKERVRFPGPRPHPGRPRPSRGVIGRGGPAKPRVSAAARAVCLTRGSGHRTHAPRRFLAATRPPQRPPRTRHGHGGRSVQGGPGEAVQDHQRELVAGHCVLPGPGDSISPQCAADTGPGAARARVIRWAQEQLQQMKSAIASRAAQQGEQVKEEELAQFLMSQFAVGMQQAEQAAYESFNTNEEAVKEATSRYSEDEEVKSEIEKLRNALRSLSGAPPNVEVPEHVTKDVVLNVVRETMEMTTNAMEEAVEEITTKHAISKAEFPVRQPPEKAPAVQKAPSVAYTYCVNVYVCLCVCLCLCVSLCARGGSPSGQVQGGRAAAARAAHAVRGEVQGREGARPGEVRHPERRAAGRHVQVRAGPGVCAGDGEHFAEAGRAVRLSACLPRDAHPLLSSSLSHTHMLTPIPLLAGSRLWASPSRRSPRCAAFAVPAALPGPSPHLRPRRATLQALAPSRDQ